MKELLKLLKKLNDTVNNVSLSSSFDDIVLFFDIVNYINDNYTTKEINKLPLKGRRGFLFIKPNNEYNSSKKQRLILINGLKKAGRDPYGMNRGVNALKTTIYCGNTNGINTNTVEFFEHCNDDEVRKIIAFQLYWYIKSFNNVFYIKL